MRHAKPATKEYAAGWNDAIETAAFMAHCAFYADPPITIPELIENIRKMSGRIDKDETK